MQVCSGPETLPHELAKASLNAFTACLNFSSSLQLSPSLCACHFAQLPMLLFIGLTGCTMLHLTVLSSCTCALTSFHEVFE